MARCIFLHIGPPKTGTSYVQGVLWVNREALRAHGLMVPFRHRRQHYWASRVVCEAVKPGGPRLHQTAWARLLRLAARYEGDVLITHELFSAANGKQAAAAIDALAQASSQVHLVVTMRDLARQLPSVWQQRVKQGHSDTFMEFMTQPRSSDMFYRRHDVRELLSRWQNTLPDERVHLVTIPASSTNDRQLWDRYAEAINVSGVEVDTSLARGNTSLGRVEVEVCRRSG